MRVAGFDIATTVGCADGVAGSRPRCWTWDLREAGKGRPARLSRLMAYCDRYFAESSLDALFYERGLGLTAAAQIGTNEDTFNMLRGAIAIVEVCAHRAGIKRIEAVGVQQARHHLLGSGKIPKGQGKELVRRRCTMLGWRTMNEDESDACAIWSLGCGLTSPASAHMTTPLFGG